MAGLPMTASGSVLKGTGNLSATTITTTQESHEKP